MIKIEEHLNGQYQFNIENIRKRPGLYVGSATVTGIYNLLFEMTEDIISVSNRADICIEINFIENDTLIIICDSVIMNESFWLEIIKALSDICEIILNGKYYIYNKGVLISETTISENSQNFFKIIFKPDKEIFSYKKLDYHTVFRRVRELAQLNENVKFLLTDNENKNIIRYNNGLESMLNDNIYLCGLGDCKPLNIYFSKDDIEVSVSMIYGFRKDISLSYANNLRTIDGGTHVKGLYDGIFCAFKKYIKDYIDEDIKIIRKDVIESLNFVIRVRINEPQFAGAVKRELTNNEVKSVVKKGITEALYEILKSDKSFLDDSRVIISAEVRSFFN